jgi:hypothetical protein
MVSARDRPIYSIKAPTPKVSNRIPDYLDSWTHSDSSKPGFFTKRAFQPTDSLKTPVSGPPCVSPNVVESPPPPKSREAKLSRRESPPIALTPSLFCNLPKITRSTIVPNRYHPKSGL